ncbi:AtpZ/AtpI family protein [Donghicola tyrosinivorans]|jgi:ATP synthase protein I|uniref:ATP synthase protein I n=1 Tax=Donghicola tyrosinivorans TaxID=1652492 RepID=A0A2T0WM37_9RHOB|nr:AtpZ/AtpI family protein [Donghicola tyrosinivorans]MEC9198402.1 AtpZ/AtpI family protein [Pseudomonadota bacterium]MEE3070000.1 AtpZ/AtpI family protein [Pseudomonadota bacterium]PRY87778.1 ATP synthase protein I [Donghicola tyrosinivorans]
MIDPAEKERLAELEARIDAAKKAAAEPEPRADEHYSQAQVAWRMVTELVAGLLIGFGMGYGLDAVFGTTPFLMLIFTLLGFIAGVKTMLRSVTEIQEKQAATAAQDDEGRNSGG